jgi:hypothetical protein
LKCSFAAEGTKPKRSSSSRNWPRSYAPKAIDPRQSNGSGYPASSSRWVTSHKLKMCERRGVRPLRLIPTGISFSSFIGLRCQILKIVLELEVEVPEDLALEPKQHYLAFGESASQLRLVRLRVRVRGRLVVLERLATDIKGARSMSFHGRDGLRAVPFWRSDPSATPSQRNLVSLKKMCAHERIRPDEPLPRGSQR